MEAPDGPPVVIGATDTFYVQTLGASTTDSEGRTTRTPTETAIVGRVDELSARDVEIAAQNGQTHDVCCLADLDVVVTDQAKIRVVTPTRLAGTYQVDTVRTNRRHLRILCSRTTVRA